MPIRSKPLRELPTTDRRKLDAFIRQLRSEAEEGSVTNASIRHGAATSVIGRAANSTGQVADIAAGADDQFLRRRSGALAFGGIVDADIPATIARDAEVAATYATIADLSAAISGLTTASGNYTPTLTSIANVDATSVVGALYSRIGSVVTVSGRIEINPTAISTPTQVGISLPIASDLANNYELQGTGACEVVQQAAAIYADTTNNRAQLEFYAVDDDARFWSFVFQYKVN